MHKVLVWLAWSLLFPTSVLANDSSNHKSTYLMLSVNELCSGMSIIHYTNSTHPNGNHNGRLNEENTGQAIVCYFDKNRHFYSKYGDLKNSQRGGTPHYGFGAVGNLVDFEHRGHELALRLGAEALRIKYDVPRYNITLKKNYTLPYYGVAYNYENKFFIGANQYLLPERVKLRSFEISWKINISKYF